MQAEGYKIGEGRRKYRDYVIEAFNRDKPFNRFLREQIAATELFDRRAQPATLPSDQYAGGDRLSSRGRGSDRRPRAR
jgi:hypothetical protein